LQKCDLDFNSEADEWFNQVFHALNENAPGTAPAIPIARKPSGKKNHSGKLLAHINLNDAGSNKETYHIEIEAPGVSYQPGDSIGIVPENTMTVVENILSLAGADTELNIDYKDELIPVKELLHKKLNIVQLPERVVKKYAAVVHQEIPVTKIDLLDLLRIYPVKDEKEFTGVIRILEPITPRLYSIASSPAAHPDEIHITVARNFFTVHDTVKYGLTSDFLSHLDENNELKFYVHPNNQFRLPAEEKNVIMIGPGTGIAPFRSFIAERDAAGATGKSWLFFGEQHFTSDFLYQTEIQNWFETGSLTKVNTAFSRDQPEKIYVQHKILKHGAEFFEWLEAGSYVYVCGTKDPMSFDVEQTVLRVIGQYGERSKEEAIAYLDNLKEDGRYITDVY